MEITYYGRRRTIKGRSCRHCRANAPYSNTYATIQGVQDQNLPKEMVTASSILVQIEKFLCQNSFLMRTIFSSP